MNIINTLVPQNLPTRIYLIGMMGVGKSTLGKQLANALGYSFLDIDEQITFIEGRSIQQIFDLEGEAYFREAERHILHQTVNEIKTVIATGGGTPCFFDNMEWINKLGKSIYLKASSGFILSRVSNNLGKRPLLKDKQLDELEPFISQILGVREPYYNQAHIQLQLPVKSFAQAVLSAI